MKKLLLLLLLFPSLAFGASEVHIRDFLGSKKCDGVDDVTTEMQNAFNASEGNTSRKIIWPAAEPGTTGCKITEPVYGNGDDVDSTFPNVFITCESEASYAFGGPSLGCALDHTAILDGPGLILDSCRGCVVENIAFRGPNTTPIGAVSDQADKDLSDWVLGTIRTNRYSPQCGIAIDATAGNPPGTVDDYPGLSYKTVTRGGADIILRDLTIEQNYIGICISPNGVSLNTDNIRLNDINFRYNGICAAWGNAQSRANTVTDGNWATCHTAMDGITIGDQQGSPPSVHGTQFGVGYQILNFSNQFSEPFEIISTGIECMKRLGSWGNGNPANNGGAPLIAIGGRWQFGCASYTDQDPPIWADIHSDALFMNLVLDSKDWDYGMNIQSYGGANIEFRKVNFAGLGIDRVTSPFIHTRNDLFHAQVRVIDSVANPTTGNAYRYSTEVKRQAQTITEGYTTDRVLMPPNPESFRLAQEKYEIINANADNYMTATWDSVQGITVNTTSDQIEFSVDWDATFPRYDFPTGTIVITPFIDTPGQSNSPFGGGCRITSYTEDTANSETDYVCSMLWEDVYYDTPYHAGSIQIITANNHIFEPGEEPTCDTLSTEYIATGCVNRDNLAVNDAMDNASRSYDNDTRVWAIGNAYDAVDYDGGVGTNVANRTYTCTGGEVIFLESFTGTTTGTVDIYVISGSDPADNDVCTLDRSASTISFTINEPVALPTVITDSVLLTRDARRTHSDALMAYNILTVDTNRWDQQGSATLSSGTVQVDLDKFQPDANYNVFITCDANETFYVTGKTTENFDITSSNASSTADCDYFLSRAKKQGE